MTNSTLDTTTSHEFPAWCLPDDKNKRTFVVTVCAKKSDDVAVNHINDVLNTRSFAITSQHSINHKASHVQFEANNLEAWHVFQTLLNDLNDVDVIVHPLSWQSKKLIICDMDMTIVDAETLDEVAELAGIGEQVSQITAQAMRGEIDFHGALRQRIALLKDQPQQTFLDVLETCRLNPGAEKLITQANANGMTTILISGGFADVAEPIAKQLGFDAVFSNQLEIENKVLSGNVIDPIVDSDYKRKTLLEFIEKLGIKPEQCCAIGDGANDIPMLNTAGLGIAYQGKPLTKEATPYQINATDLETALYFMGLE